MKQVLREVIAYVAASGVGLLVDVGLLWALVEHGGWHYLAAATVSFIAGTVVVYLFSVGLIFRHRRIQDRRLEFGLFAMIGILGVLMNLAVLKIAVDGFGAHYLIGKLASIGFTFSINFGLRRALLFTAPSGVRRTQQSTTGLPE